MSKYKAMPIKEETDELCKHGCGNIAKFITKTGNKICSEYSAKCPELKRKNSEKIKKAHSEGRIPSWNEIENLNRSWAKGHTKATHPGIAKQAKSHTIPLIEILQGLHPTYQSYKLKNKLIDEGIKENKCEECGIKDWNKKKLVMELHHIDGNKRNNLLENLMFLCPNCHAQTDNYCSKNRI